MEFERCYSCMNIKTGSPFCEHCGFDERIQNAAHQLPMGTVLRGQYVVGKVLGQGGFGITYMGWDQFLSTPVAIKEYYPNGFVLRDAARTTMITNCESASGNVFEKNRERFLREAQSLARLSGIPQVVRVQNYFTENGTAYIAMEFVQGKTLKEYVKQYGRLSPQWVFGVLGAVLDGLEQVHRLGIIHRDLTPDNIMVTPDGRVKLLDFGAVRDYVDVDAMRSTQAIVKPGFAPPEQYQARGNMGPWTDLYSLCATVFYCLSGRLPPDAPERMIAGTQPEWGTLQGIGLHQIAALQKGLSLRAEDRFQSAAQMRAALQAPQIQPEPTRPEPTRPEPTRPEPSKPEAPKPNPRKPGKKARIVKLVAAWLAVAALGAVVPKLFDGERTNSTAGKSLVVPEETQPMETQPEETQPMETQPMETQPEESQPVETMSEQISSCTVRTVSGGKQYTGPNLDVFVSSGGKVQATVSGLDIQASYPVNDPQVDTGYNDVKWILRLRSADSCTMLSVGWNKENKGTPKQIPMEQMQTKVLLKESGESSYNNAGTLDSMNWTPTSLTMEAQLPDSFDYSNIDQIEVFFYHFKDGVEWETIFPVN